MPEYLAPGVYVEEIDTGTKTIEGVSTSTAGFVGVTRRGPTSGLPVLVTSFPEFVRNFGDYFDFGPTFAAHRYLPFAADGFFANGGKRLYVMRVAASGGGAPTMASTAATGGLITRLRAGQDAAVGATVIQPATLRGITAGTIIRLVMVREGVTYTSNDVTVASVNAATGEATVGPALTIAPVGPVSFEASRTVVMTDVRQVNTGGSNPGTIQALATMTSARPSTFTIQAKDPGSWGREIVVQVTHENGGRSQVDVHLQAASDNTRVRLTSTAGFYTDAWVEIDHATSKRYRRVRSVDGSAITLWGQSLAAVDLPPGTPIAVCEFKVTASYGGVVEQFSGLTLEQVPGKFVGDVINQGSNLLTIAWAAAPAAGLRHPFLVPSAADGLTVRLDTGGSDGSAPVDADYRGGELASGARTGIRALENIDQISIIAAPGATGQIVQNALIEQCERLKDRFAILDPAPRSGNQAPLPNDVMNQRNLYDTKYAAFYYPRLISFDPLNNADIPIPPSGHMAGIYARTDIERGVHKAPANEVVRMITGLELTITKEVQDILNPLPVNINVIRDFRADGRGFRVWGARCITSDSDWKYVPVRRLFIFLEESLDQGTQWVVFEPNDEPLWARVRQSVENFLTRVWRDGALQGAKPEEAYFVKCDRTTMTQDDIDNGRLIMIIGVAPVKPAEFVIIRIGQWAGGSEVKEV